MPKYILLIIICAILSISTIAKADGKFYYKDLIPTDLPFQRAAIYFENETETLIVQSKYEATSEDAKGLDIAWIVPVPNKPELIETRPHFAYSFFLQLSLYASPKVIILSHIVLITAVLLLIFLLVRSHGRYLKKNRNIPKPDIRRQQILYFVGLCVFALFIFSITMPSLGKAKGVDVIESRKVGVYDVNVIKSDSAQAITQWLDEHGFKYSEKDIAVFEKYVCNGWCFVTAKIHQDADPDMILSGSMASPLCLRFKTEKPVYPMALTASASPQTEVLLFVLSDCKMYSSTAMKTEFYGKGHIPRINLSENSPTEYLGFDSKTFNLTKLRSKFTPDQMTEDIYFSKAENQEPYRPTKIVW